MNEQINRKMCTYTQRTMGSVQEAFQEPLDSSKRQALWALFKVDLREVEGVLEDPCEPRRPPFARRQLCVFMAAVMELS
jgi:hypothetical protein